jgi:hypothetical protein
MEVFLHINTDRIQLAHESSVTFSSRYRCSFEKSVDKSLSAIAIANILLLAEMRVLFFSSLLLDQRCANQNDRPNCHIS